MWRTAGGAPFKPSGPGVIRFLALGPGGMGTELNPCYPGGARGVATVFHCYKHEVHTRNLIVEGLNVAIEDLAVGAVTINCDVHGQWLTPDPGDTWKKQKANCYWTQYPASQDSRPFIYVP